MKNVKILNYVNTLNTFVNMKLPVRISNVILRNLQLLQKEYDVYETQLNMIYESYKDYMVKDKKGNIQKGDYGIPVVDDDHAEKFINEINELLNLDVDDINLYKIDKIGEDAFDHPDNEKFYVTPIQINALKNIIEKQKPESTED